MLHFGENDGGIPMSDIEKIKRAVIRDGAGLSPIPAPVTLQPRRHAGPPRRRRQARARAHAAFLREHVG